MMKNNTNFHLMRIIKVSEGQTLLDIAMQHCGDVSAVYEIADLNGKSVTDDLVIGEDLKVPDAIDNRIVTMFEDTYLYPASWENPESSEVNGEGLEYWAIEFDFVIS